MAVVKSLSGAKTVVSDDTQNAEMSGQALRYVEEEAQIVGKIAGYQAKLDGKSDEEVKALSDAVDVYSRSISYFREKNGVLRDAGLSEQYDAEQNLRSRYPDMSEEMIADVRDAYQKADAVYDENVTTNSANLPISTQTERGVALLAGYQAQVDGKTPEEAAVVQENVLHYQELLDENGGLVRFSNMKMDPSVEISAKIKFEALYSGQDTDAVADAYHYANSVHDARSGIEVMSPSQSQAVVTSEPNPETEITMLHPVESEKPFSLKDADSDVQFIGAAAFYQAQIDGMSPDRARELQEMVAACQEAANADKASLLQDTDNDRQGASIATPVNISPVNSDPGAVLQEKYPELTEADRAVVIDYYQQAAHSYEQTMDDISKYSFVSTDIYLQSAGVAMAVGSQALMDGASPEEAKLKHDVMMCYQQAACKDGITVIPNEIDGRFAVAKAFPDYDANAASGEYRITSRGYQQSLDPSYMKMVDMDSEDEQIALTANYTAQMQGVSAEDAVKLQDAVLCYEKAMSDYMSENMTRNVDGQKVYVGGDLLDMQWQLLHDGSEQAGKNALQRQYPDMDVEAVITSYEQAKEEYQDYQDAKKNEYTYSTYGIDNGIDDLVYHAQMDGRESFTQQLYSLAIGEMQRAMNHEDLDKITPLQNQMDHMAAAFASNDVKEENIEQIFERDIYSRKEFLQDHALNKTAFEAEQTKPQGSFAEQTAPVSSAEQTPTTFNREQETADLVSGIAPTTGTNFSYDNMDQ